MRASDALLFVGFALVVAGVAMWSIPAALCVAGAVLFAAGGFASRGETK